jgi:hypothetical protein
MSKNNIKYAGTIIKMFRDTLCVICLQFFKFGWITHSTIIPYFTGILKKLGAYMQSKVFSRFCLTHLRYSYSFLNYDLSKVNIVNDAGCSCGAPRDDAFHYFVTCPNYTEIRRIMMNNLNWVQTSDLDLNLLTCGSDDLTYKENINIIKHVFNFIKSSKRFLSVYHH